MQINVKNNLLYQILLLVFSILLSACGKEDTTDKNVCGGKTIVINTSADSASTLFASDGRISVTASGSNGFTYKLNSTGTYSTTSVFSGLAANSYIVFVKDSAGCEKTKTVSVPAKGALLNPCTGTPGPKFNAVKNLIISRCNSCHSGGSPDGGLDLSVDCTIVNSKTRIKVRAVDQGNMPPRGPALSSDDKQKITDWINAGGRITD
jgi:hypothetical protein